MLKVYFSLGYHVACDIVAEKCDIKRMTSRKLSDIRVSYRLAIFCKFIRGGRYHLDRFLRKSIPYPFITMFLDFRPDIDRNDESLKIVKRYLDEKTMHCKCISSIRFFNFG